MNVIISNREIAFIFTITSSSYRRIRLPNVHFSRVIDYLCFILFFQMKKLYIVWRIRHHKTERRMALYTCFIFMKSIDTCDIILKSRTLKEKMYNVKNNETFRVQLSQLLRTVTMFILFKYSVITPYQLFKCITAYYINWIIGTVRILCI